MSNVSVTKSINISAAAAWAELSSFSGIENYSPVAKSTTKGSGAGATRVCELPDGAKIDESLDLVNADKMHFRYSIIEGPFPVTDYVSDVVVTATGEDSCDITWSCTYNADEENVASMNELFGGFYNVIIEELESYVKASV